MLDDQTEKNRCRPEDEDLTPCRLFTLIDLDAMFYNNPDARIINSETLTDPKPAKNFTDAIYSSCDGELGFVPTCQCGYTRGTTKEGIMCPRCNTVCSSQFIDHLDHVAWLGIPEKLPPVLHPVWYAVLKDWSSIGKKGESVIDIILNPEKDVPDDLAPYIHGRGFRYFYENADQIMHDLIYNFARTARKPKTVNIITFMKYYRNVMFTRHLPILHSSLHPRKSNGSTLSYVDQSSSKILEAVNDLSAECFREHSTVVPERQANIKLYRIYITIVGKPASQDPGYYERIVTSKLGAKPGLLRKHNFGSRIHFSLRTVVVPQDRVLPMDEVLLPWGVIVNGLKLPILNYLVHVKHKSLEESLDIFARALTSYDPSVDEAMTKFIQDAPDHQVAIAIGRNPA